MSLFVDNFYVISNQQKPLDDLYNVLNSTYGEISCKQSDMLEYLEMSIVRKSERTVTNWQPVYIDKMILLASITSGKDTKTKGLYFALNRK